MYKTPVIIIINDKTFSLDLYVIYKYACGVVMPINNDVSLLLFLIPLLQLTTIFPVHISRIWYE